jgi:putative transposase
MSSWISKQEVAQLEGCTLRHVERLADEGKIQSRIAKAKSANGRQHREFAVYSLSADAQKKFFKLTLTAAASGGSGMGTVDGTALQRIGASGKPAAPTASAVALQRGIFDSAPELADVHRVILPPELEKQAQERYAAIAPLLEFPTKYAGRAAHDAPELRSLSTFTKWIATQRGIPERTLWRWYARFKAKGYAALADARRSDKGTSRFFEEYPVLGEFVQAKYLGAGDSPHLSFRAIHEALQRKCRERALDAPDYKTVRMYLKRSIPNVVRIMARDGEREYHDRCELYILPKYTDHAANDIWVSDHCKHDVWVRNDIFPDLPQDAAVRPWLSAIIDYRTRKPLGLTWCANPSSETVPLRMALLEYGPPHEMYMDNGKDYQKLARVNEISPQAAGVLVRLEIKCTHCLPRHPQSKHVERWFRTVHERFDKQWGKAYSGTSPKDRPESCDQLLKQHEQMLKRGTPDKSPLPLASKFVGAALAWISGWYSDEHKHSGRGMDGFTPNQLFDQQYPPEQRRKADPRLLDELLRDRVRRHVIEGGCVRLNKALYEPANPESRTALINRIEEEILVAPDPLNIGEVIAIDLDGNFIGLLQAQKLLEHGPTSQAEVRESLRMRRAIAGAIKGHIQRLAQKRIAAGDKPEIQQWLERAESIEAPQIHRARELPAMGKIAQIAAAPVGYDDVADSFFEEKTDEIG